MPIDKVSAAQFEADIAAGINDRAPNIDTTFGPIPDACTKPQAAVFEAQNDRARKLSFLLSLVDPTEFEGYETDLEGIAFNEGLVRSEGASSSTTAVFGKKATPTVDLLVPRSFPIGSEEDADGQTITFVTSEAKTLTAAAASSYFNLETDQYELSVPVVAITTGTVTNVGPNTLTRMLRTSAFDSVTNTVAASGGRDQETNAELIDRYLLGVIGRQLGTPFGIERLARATFSAIEDIYIVYGTNELLERAADDAGAVDAWVKGEDVIQIAESRTYLGVGQTITLSSPPLVEVVSVVLTGTATTYIDGTDFEVVLDDSGVGRSTRGVDGIRFLPTATTTLPNVGDFVTVTYTANNLIRALQSQFDLEDTLELGRDLLFREGVEVPIVHTANLRVAAGFNTSDVLDLVEVAVLNLVNTTLGLGGSVEGSDIQGVVRAISGVDNYVITRLTRATVLTGTADIAMGGNEYPTLEATNLTITLI